MITIYTKTACPKCRMVKMLLDREEVDYSSVNIDMNEKAMNDLLDQGFHSLPVTMKEGTAPEESVVGFQPDQLKALYE